MPLTTDVPDDADIARRVDELRAEGVGLVAGSITDLAGVAATTDLTGCSMASGGIPAPLRRDPAAPPSPPARRRSIPAADEPTTG